MCVILIFSYLTYKKYEINKSLLIEEENLKNKIEVEKTTLEDISKLSNKMTSEMVEEHNKRKEALSQEAENFYNEKIQFMKQKLELDLPKISEEYDAYRDECTQVYLELLAELKDNYIEDQTSKTLVLSKLEKRIQDAMKVEAAAVEARKREEEMQEKQNFYRITLLDKDADDILSLRSIINSLNNKETICKIIWKVYYEKPTNEMIGRVVGSTVKTGIYKITNIENKKAYIGQAVNISDRWKQHIKRGLGADTPTRNKLYPAMDAFGVENFTFEIIEECGKADLSSKEDYWQDYFKVKEFGYSIK